MLGIDARAARCTWTAALILLLLFLAYLMRGTIISRTESSLRSSTRWIISSCASGR